MLLHFHLAATKKAQRERQILAAFISFVGYNAKTYKEDFMINNQIALHVDIIAIELVSVHKKVGPLSLISPSPKDY